ncbi:MAG: flavodoxin [Chloroflexi bacterium RBG_13_51_36]|nr:MAG: flavodoxin [Chloroflexi bacterium RBG_13_51_36]
MKALVVYDSVYGNTEKIAKAIGDAIAPSGEVKVLRAGEASPSELVSIDLLIVGSPTHAGRPVQAVQEFLKKVPELSLKGVKVAAFDTRISKKIVGVFGYAAGRIVDNLKKKGGSLVASPEGFFVTGGEGPLKGGELERAAAWVKGILGAKK